MRLREMKDEELIESKKENFEVILKDIDQRKLLQKQSYFMKCPQCGARFGRSVKDIKDKVRVKKVARMHCTSQCNISFQNVARTQAKEDQNEKGTA